MNRRHTLAELLMISFLFLSISIGGLVVLEKNFPQDFVGMTGMVSSIVNISQPTSGNCNFTIYDGWNYLSFFCITTLEDLDNILSYMDGYEVIYRYDSTSPTDPWKVYKPDMPSWVYNDLDYFSRKDGYIFYFNIDSPQEIFINGSKRIPTSVPIREGWNLVGYPTNIQRDIDLAFVSINGSYNLIVSLNNSDKSFQNRTSNLTGTLNFTTPYRAYWINTSNTDTWVVNW